MDMDTVYTLGLVVLAGLFAYSRMLRNKNRSIVATAIADGAVVVDVRSPSEFETDHYDRAINIPLDVLEEKSAKIGAKDTLVVVYCASGQRSAAAAAMLRSAGFTQVVNGGGLSTLPQRK